MVDIIIAKVKKGEGRMKLKVTKKVKNQSGDASYQNVIDVRDSQQLACFFEDIQTLFDAPIDKAFRIMKSKKGGPFW